MRKRHNYKNLKTCPSSRRVWQLGLKLALDVSDILETFPKHEQFGLTSQISRCSISMPSNISEASAGTDKAFSNYLDIALGSSFELGIQLLAYHKKYITENRLLEMENKISEWQKMTMGFQNCLMV